MARFFADCLRTACQLVKDVFIPWAPRERAVLLTLVVVYTAWRTGVECFRFTIAKRYHQQGQRFYSLLQVEEVVWHNGPWQGILLYEISDALLCICQSFGTKLIAAYGLGYASISQAVIIGVAICTGLAYSLLETGSRLSESGGMSEVLKIFSYVAAWTGWFLVLPLLYWNLTKGLKYDRFNLALTSSINFFGLILVCAMRVWGYQTFNYVNAFLIMLQLSAASRLRSFHTVGFLLGIISWYALFPSYCIEATKVMQAFLSTGFLKALTNVLVSGISQTLLWRLALGSLMPHSAIVVCFTIQFMEHLWNKIILVREDTFSLQYVVTACVPLLYHLLSGSLIDQILIRQLWANDCVRSIIGDRRISGQAPWKEVLLSELRMIKTLNNFFADMLATSCIITIAIVQQIMSHYGFEGAFDLGNESLWSRLIGLLCIFICTLVLGLTLRICYEIQLSRSLSQLESRKEELSQAMRIIVNGTYSDVDPVRYVSRYSDVYSIVDRYTAASMEHKYFERFCMFQQLTADQPALSMHVPCREVQNFVWRKSFVFFLATSVYITGQLMYDVTRIDELITK